MGGGTIPQFEARYFAEKTDAVIVTVNYRLGTLDNYLQARYDSVTRLSVKAMLYAFAYA